MIPAIVASKLLRRPHASLERERDYRREIDWNQRRLMLLAEEAAILLHRGKCRFSAGLPLATSDCGPVLKECNGYGY